MGTRTTAQRRPTRVTITLLATLSLLLSQLAFFASTPAFALNVGNDLNQWANGKPGTNVADGSWQNGNLNANNSQYREGDSVAFRRPMSGFEAGKTYRVQINYDTVNNGLVAYDYLTSWDRTASEADPTVGLAAFAGGPDDTHEIPADPRLANTPAFTSSVVSDRDMAIWGGTLLSVGNYQYSSGNQTTAYSGSGTTTTTLDVVFTADGPNVLLAWGGHIAVANQWTYPTAPRNTNGSPYHMRNIGNVAELAGPGDPTVVDTSNVGNQDRSLKASAVLVPGLLMNKTIVGDLETVQPGDQFTYRIVVTNDGEGGSTLTNVHVTDTIVGIFKVQSITPSAGADCSASSGQDVDCTIAALAAGDSATIDVTVEVVLPSTDPDECGSYANDAQAVAGELSATDRVDIEVVGCDPDLDIVKRAEQDGTDISGGSVSLGDTFTYVIEVTNDADAPSNAQNVVITDEVTSALDIEGTPGWAITPAPTSDGDCMTSAGPTGGTLVTCEVGDLEPGQTARVEIDVRVPRVANTCSPQDNLAAADADNHDPIEIEDPVTVDIDGCAPELSFVKSVDDASIAPGGSTSYSITASNGEDATETARVKISDVVDDVFTIGPVTYTAPAGSEVAGFDCDASGQTVTCGEVDLEPGESFTVTIPVTADAIALGDLEDDTLCGSVPNTASLYVDGDELTGEEDVVGTWDPSALVEIEGCEADVDLEKSVDVTSISVDDGEAVYTLRVDNAADATATALGVELTDTIDDAFVITHVGYDTTGTLDAAFECDNDGQEVECGPVDLAPGEYFEVEVTVMAAEGVDLCDTYPNVFGATWTDAGTTDAAGDTSDEVDLEIEGCIADVVLDKTVDTDSILLGDPDSTATYRVTATVTGDSTASVTDLTIGDDSLDDTIFEVVAVAAYIVPAGATTLAELVAVPCEAPATGTAVTCSLPDGSVLAPGDAFIVEIEVRSIATILDACESWPNVATVTWTDAYGQTGDGEDDALLTIESCAPAISLVKEVDQDVVTITPDDEPPFQVTYTYTITNTGNVDLFDLTLDDDVIGDLTDELEVADLPIGASTQVIVTYELTAADIEAGSVVNLAVVTGNADDDTTVSDEDDARVDIVVVLERILGLEIVKEALLPEDAQGNKTITIDEGENATVTYRYTITNTGTEMLEDLTLDDDVIGDLTDELAAVLPGLSLAAGGSVVVEVDYTLTGAQVAAGEVENVAIVTGHDEFGVEVSAQDDEVVHVVEVLEVVKPLPKTGSDTTLMTAWGLLLASLGAAALLFTTRRRPDTA